MSTRFGAARRTFTIFLESVQLAFMHQRARCASCQPQGVFMKRLISTQSLASVVIVLGAFAAASVAHARSDVYFSVGVQIPGVYMAPAPVYVQPRPVYLPEPGYYGRHDDGRRYGGQHWERGGPYGDRDHDGIANVYDPDSPRNQWRHARLYGPYGDLDRDGIKNQYDRDRDGDGVRNRYDRLPDNPYRR
ncbi:MAG: PXPV repeat protein [Burkholderiaceae bacterium]|nr:PXPV repeat protein [Burkholderiaceae bacterium]